MKICCSAVCSGRLATTASTGSAQFPPLAAPRKLFRGDPVHAQSTSGKCLSKWEGVVRFRFFVLYPLRLSHSLATTMYQSSPGEMNDRPRPRHGAKRSVYARKMSECQLATGRSQEGKTQRKTREEREGDCDKQQIQGQTSRCSKQQGAQPVLAKQCPLKSLGHATHTSNSRARGCHWKIAGEQRG